MGWERPERERCLWVFVQECKGGLGWEQSSWLTCCTCALCFFTGQLEMDIPDFIKIDHDAEARRATLSVANRDEKEQREMWGMANTFLV